jgi:uncharacterized membrane protein YgcG
MTLLPLTAMILTPKFSSRIADRGAFGISIQAQEKMMKAAQYFKAGVIGIALLGAGSVLAEDLPLPADPAQQREKMRGMSSEDRTAYREQNREQMQERVRSMTPEEQKLMRETRSDGRNRVENQQADGTRQRSRDGSGQGGGYGQGYESRRGDGSGSGGGGRGMGGGGGGRGR